MDKLIKEKSLSQKAYDSLCEIIKEMTPCRNKLPSEDDIAKSMGISRATVREALKYLMMDRVITTIHGKGTFAHPAVLRAENRMDLYTDFGQMLSTRYNNVQVKIDWVGLKKPDSFFSENFGAACEEAYCSGWTYTADEKIMLYGHYELSPEYVIREVTDVEGIASLPQFSSKYMQAAIDYCVMLSTIKSNPEVCRRFGIPENTSLHCWDELIYDIEDRLVGIGEVYVHPKNMTLSVVTRFES